MTLSSIGVIAGVNGLRERMPDHYDQRQSDPARFSSPSTASLALATTTTLGPLLHNGEAAAAALVHSR